MESKDLIINYLDPERKLEDYPGMGKRIWISKEEALEFLPMAYDNKEWGFHPILLDP